MEHRLELQAFFGPRTLLFARLVGDWLFCDKESGEDAVEATQIHRLAWLKFLQRLVRLDFEK